MSSDIDNGYEALAVRILTDIATDYMRLLSAYKKASTHYLKERFRSDIYLQESCIRRHEIIALVADPEDVISKLRKKVLGREEL